MDRRNQLYVYSISDTRTGLMNAKSRYVFMLFVCFMCGNRPGREVEIKKSGVLGRGRLFPPLRRYNAVAYHDIMPCEIYFMFMRTGILLLSQIA